MAAAPTKRPVSAVWDYFTVVVGREEVATCNICSSEMRRGSAGASSKSFSTKSLWGHLKAKHKDEHCLAEEKQAEGLLKKGKKTKVLEDSVQVCVQEKPPCSSASEQLPLVETLDAGRPWDARHSAQTEGERLLTYWLCDALKGSETVGNAHFLRFVRHLSKEFKVPSEKILRTKHVPELNRSVQFAVMQSLKSNASENGTCSITTDVWSAPGKDSFMSITAHWVTKDFKRKRAALRCVRYSTAHEAADLASAVRNTCTDWGLKNVHVAVTYSASNIILAVKNAGYHSIGCFCHILHLVVQHSVLEDAGVRLMVNR